MTNHEIKPSGFKLENLALPLRFLLPTMFAIFFYAYQGDMHSIKDSILDIKSAQTQNIADLKVSQTQIWQTLNNFKDETNNRFIAIYQKLN